MNTENFYEIDINDELLKLSEIMVCKYLERQV